MTLARLSLSLAAGGTATNTFSFTAASCGNGSNAVSSQRLSAASDRFDKELEECNGIAKVYGVPQ